jgi:hypothetical protein
MLSKRFTFSKRQLGILMLIAGVGGFAAIIGIDIIDFGRDGGIGPAQQIALGAATLIALVGITLIPIDDTPA